MRLCFNWLMMRRILPAVVCLLLLLPAIGMLPAQDVGLPDIRQVKPDLEVVPMTQGEPAPGKRVRRTLPEYRDANVYHALYLPTDWKTGESFPVIVEYAGNGPYRSPFGDVCTGKVEDCNLGYGISGGSGYIWVCIPYVSKDGQQNQLQWWGDIAATVDYCKKVVPRICKQFGGNPEKVILSGFSRGSIACNYIGLHDDEIAALWCAFLCHSHYDGMREWNYEGSDKTAAAKRLRRLGAKPQFIISEGNSIPAVQHYLKETHPAGNFTFRTLPYRNHTDVWVLRDIAERQAVRQWLVKVTNEKD